MGRRELVPGDRVKIVGPWDTHTRNGEGYIGRIATVLRNLGPKSRAPIPINIDTKSTPYYWCRENLRALPRKEEVK